MRRFVFSSLMILMFVLSACEAADATPTPKPARIVSVTATPVPPRALGAPVSPVPTPALAATQSIKIGLLTDRDGELAAYGAMLENGFALGLSYATNGKNTIAGRAIEIVIRDTQSDAATGVQAARDLIEKDHVDVLIGAPSSEVTLAVADVVKQAKKILIVAPAASADLTGARFNPYVFRTSRTTDQDWLAGQAALAKLGKTFVQIAPADAVGYVSTPRLYQAVKANGGTFVLNDTPDQFGTVLIPPSTLDFTPHLRQVLNAKPDSVIVTWSGMGVTSLFAQMQQLGMFKSFHVFTGIGDNATIKTGYSAALGVTGMVTYHYTLPKTTINDWLVQNHVSKFKTPPDIFTESGFTAAQLLIAGLITTQGDPAADKLITAFEGSSFQGPKGIYSVRASDHVLLQPMYVVKLTNTDNPDSKFFDLLAELKPTETAPPCRLEGEYQSRCK